MGNSEILAKAEDELSEGSLWLHLINYPQKVSISHIKFQSESKLGRDLLIFSLNI